MKSYTRQVKSEVLLVGEMPKMYLCFSKVSSIYIFTQYTGYAVWIMLNSDTGRDIYLNTLAERMPAAEVAGCWARPSTCAWNWQNSQDGLMIFTSFLRARQWIYYIPFPFRKLNKCLSFECGMLHSGISTDHACHLTNNAPFDSNSYTLKR